MRSTYLDRRKQKPHAVKRTRLDRLGRWRMRLLLSRGVSRSHVGTGVWICHVAAGNVQTTEERRKENNNGKTRDRVCRIQLRSRGETRI